MYSYVPSILDTKAQKTSCFSYLEGFRLTPIQPLFAPFRPALVFRVIVHWPKSTSGVHPSSLTLRKGVPIGPICAPGKDLRGVRRRDKRCRGRLRVKRRSFSAFATFQVSSERLKPSSLCWGRVYVASIARALPDRVAAYTQSTGNSADLRPLPGQCSDCVLFLHRDGSGRRAPPEGTLWHPVTSGVAHR